MRLSKFLTLSVAMSRNQAKYCIRKGRVFVAGQLVTDPDCEISETSDATFDGNPISIVSYQYFMLNKPVSFVCTTTESESNSVLNLIRNQSKEKKYYLANILRTELSGLVLISDNARWVNRTKLKMLEKKSVYRLESKRHVSDEEVLEIKKAWLTSEKKQSGSTIDIQKKDAQTLILSIKQLRVTDLLEICSSLNIPIEKIHLKQVGRLDLGDLETGGYLELTEKDIRL